MNARIEGAEPFVRNPAVRQSPIAKSRGKPFELDDRIVLVTYHPSAVLRADEAAAEIRAALVTDLRAADAAASESAQRSSRKYGTASDAGAALARTRRLNPARPAGTRISTSVTRYGNIAST